MEENKNQEKKEGHDGKKCHGACCHGNCSHSNIVKIVLAVIIVVVLLSIGAAFGARRAGRFCGFNQNAYGPGMMGNWQDEGRNDRQFRGMRGNQNLQTQGTQALEGNAPVGTQPAGNPAAPIGTTTPINY